VGQRKGVRPVRWGAASVSRLVGRCFSKPLTVQEGGKSRHGKEIPCEAVQKHRRRCEPAQPTPNGDRRGRHDRYRTTHTVTLELASSECESGPSTTRSDTNRLNPHTAPSLTLAPVSLFLQKDANNPGANSSLHSQCRALCFFSRASRA